MKTKPNSNPHTQRLITTTLALICLVSIFAASIYFSHGRKETAAVAPSGQDRAAHSQVSEAYGRLPMSFEVNRGQTDARVKYVARGSGYSLFLTPDEAVLSLSAASSNPKIEEEAAGGLARKMVRPFNAGQASETEHAVLRMKVLGASQRAKVEGLDEMPGKSNYFIGQDPQKWSQGVSNFSRVKYQDIYRGVDLVYYGNQRQLEYDFVIKPGTDPKQIALGFEGAERIDVDGAGDLVLSVAGRELRQHRPYAYQEINGTRQEIASRYALVGHNQVGFELGDYDATKPLVIDPVLVYSTYLGGSGFEQASGMTVDASGNAYVVGYTASLNFPGSALPQLQNGDSSANAFVTKISAAGTSVIYSSYFGGTGSEVGFGIAVDPDGNAYVTGYTNSPNFPVSSGAFQVNLAGGTGVFFASDNGGQSWAPSDSGLLATTVSVIRAHPVDPSIVFAGTFTSGVFKSVNRGATWDSISDSQIFFHINDMVVDPSNPDNLVVSGSTPAGTTPVSWSSDGGQTWNTPTGLLPASNNYTESLALDPNHPGTIYVAYGANGGVYKSLDSGHTWAAANGTVAGQQMPTSGGINGLAVDPNTSAVYAATFTGVYKSTDGGATWAKGSSSPVLDDADGDTIVVDGTTSPSTIYLAASNGVQKSTDGLTWASINTSLRPNTLALDRTTTPATLYVGTTGSGVFKTTDGGQNWSPSGLSDSMVYALLPESRTAPVKVYAGVYQGSDAFVTKLSADGSSIIYSTYLGGGASPVPHSNPDDVGSGIAIDAGGNAYVTGYAKGGAFPTRNAKQPTFGGISDAFISKINPTGTDLVYSTFIGGGDEDYGKGIAVDASGSAYIVGYTGSSDDPNTSAVNEGFPTKNAIQPGNASPGTNYDAFITKMNPSGSDFTYSTYLGGGGNDQGTGIALDAGGNVYVAGLTTSGNFPIVNAYQGTKGTGGTSANDSFVGKLNAAGTSYGYLTYLGGSNNDRASAIAVDQAGNAYVVGWTNSTNFPTRNPIQGSFGGGTFDAYVTTYSPTGSQLNSTYFGGASNDQALGVAAGPAGSDAVYVTGVTDSTNLIVPGGVQGTKGGGTDAFVAKLGAVSGSSATDLSLSMTDSPDPVDINTNLTYTITVTNSGDVNVTGVIVTDTLPANTTLVSATGCTGTSTLTCNLGNLASGQSASLTVVIKPTQGGSLSNTASVAAAQAESNTANNSATQVTTVTGGTVYTVNSTADTTDAQGCDATNCTLREAINAANSHPGKDTILFNIPGAGAHTINATPGFSGISEAVFIDGTSQPGFTGQPIIEVNGASAGQVNGFWVTGGGTRLRGLVINGFFYSAINLQGDNNVVEGCYIGTNLAGTSAVPNGGGINVDNGANDVIGGLTSDARNVISGNNGNGVGVQATATATKIQGNYIGLNASGTAALPQANWAPGVGLYSATGITVGGTEAGARNIISGNKGTGVWVATSFPSGPGSANNTVQGNYIGTTPDGNGALINEGGGIGITTGSNNNLIGGTTPSARNVVAGGVNLDTGVFANRIQGNYIGVKADGSARIITTGWAGVQMRGVSNNVIGGDVPGAGNVISGNNGPGIWIVNTCTECNPPQANIISSNNLVQGNIIGLNPSGTAAIPNNGSGVGIERGSTGNIVGGTTPGARNIISGNQGEGVNINSTTSPANGNSVLGNYIGLKADGSAVVRNNSNGVGVYGVSGTTISGNVISGNGGDGIDVHDGRADQNAAPVQASNTTVQNNLIGTNPAGTAVMGNTNTGLSIGSANNTTVSGNTISGSGGDGVSISNNWDDPRGSTSTTVRGNRIGTSADGMSALPNNSGLSIYAGSTGNTIGGPNASDRNIISGNNQRGVSIYNTNGPSNNNTIQGNYIGIKSDGSGALPNGASGIGLYGINGTQVVGNVLSGNLQGGIHIWGGSTAQGQPIVGSTNTSVRGNFIGTNPTGTFAIPNGSNGVGILLGSLATNNTIGGLNPADRNIISGNNSDGINIGNFNGPASGNIIQGNYIGTNASGSAALPNATTGISVFGASGTQIGGTVAGAGNLISGNNGSGINMGEASPGGGQPNLPVTNTHIEGNFIGTNAAGTAALRNQQFGVNISGTNSSGNYVGGSTPGARNLIGANGFNAVSLNTRSDGNFILGNWMGVDITGTTALVTNSGGTISYGNGSGVVISGASNNQVGGTTAAERNVIAGNGCQGVNIANVNSNGTIIQATGNKVQGNYIGLNAAGTDMVVDPTNGTKFGNKCSGVFLAGVTGNTVGGTQQGAGNVIGGSSHQGVVISNNNNVIGSNNTVQGNIIGSNVSMTTPLPNGIGIFLINGASNNQIGGDDAADGTLDGIVNAGNKIFGSTGDGINIQSAFINNASVIATGNKVQGNLIGGSATLKNVNNGINLNGAINTLIGGTTAGAGNTISFNNNNGIVLNCSTLGSTITCSVGNQILRNSIFSHPNNLGIRFNSNGTNFGNNNQVSPTISFASASGGGTVAQGSLTTGVANQAYTLEFFSNDACSPAGSGEGQNYIGTYDVTTDASGTVNFTTPALGAAAVGKIITATATHPVNGTSRFSQCTVNASATANISGRVTDEATGLSGVTVTLSGGQSTTTTTDAQGNYTFANLPSNASYSVSASQSGNTFSPASWDFDRLRGNQVANFTKLKVQYSITDLGTLGGTNSFGIGINESGQVVGRAQTTGNAATHGFLYSGNGPMTDLGTFGGASSDVRAVNDSGKVVGDANTTGNAANHAFFYINGTKTDLGTFGGNSFGRGINNAGQVVGYSDLPNGGGTRAFRTAPNALINPATDNLGTLPGGTFSQAFSINETGHVAGTSGAAGGISRAFLYNGSVMQNLGTLPGGTNSLAFFINDSDVAVGRSEFAPGNSATRATIYSNGTVTDLGTLGGINSSANAINNANVVVGHSEFNSGNLVAFVQAFIYKNGAMVNLNARIPANSGWNLTTAQSINDAGQITGYGVINGQTHAFLLTPTTKTAQSVTFDSQPSAQVYGNTPFTVSATASSGLPVTYSLTGPATINGNTITITGAGTITVTATQAGDDAYSSATATQTINVAKKALTVTADGKTRLYGAPDSSFTASYFGFVNGDTPASSLGGTLSFTTGATQASAVGTYTITPSGISSNNYQPNYQQGTLTIGKASTTTTSGNYSLTVPGSVNLLAQVAADSPSTLPVTGGTVTFVIRQGTTTIATLVSGPVAGGQASASFNVASGGAYTIYSSYGGNSNYSGSTGLASLTVGNANPVPSITGLTPDSTVKKTTTTGEFTLLIDGNGFMSTQNGSPANSSVDWYDRTTGQHTTLSTTSIAGAQIQAVVPNSLLGDGKTVEVSVINPGPGGGASNVQPFFITDTTATVTSAETVITDPVSGAASTTSVTPTGAVLSAEAISSSGGGSGTLTVAQYSGDPIGTNASPETSAFSTSNGSSYFDVYVAPGSSFTQLTLEYANTGGTSLYWWNGSVWGLVSNQTYNPTTGVITVTVTATSSPSLAQLTGTVFGVASGPTVNSITISPSSTVALGNTITLNSSFTDACACGPYTAEITWGDGLPPTPVNVTGTSLTSLHKYAAAGTYSIKVKVSRGSTFGTNTFSPVVVFDAGAGFLTGGGWFNSPLGAFPASPSFTGKVQFETSIKYENGASTPTGMTKVSLPGMSFTASRFSWLSVMGTKVQAGGTGTINGAGSYGFLLTGIDGKLDGKMQPDKLRVKIWNQSTGQIIYDNQMSAVNDASPVLVLGGGNITIHK